MKVLWIIPLTVDQALQFTSKNELARSFSGLGHEINTVVAYVRERTQMDGFSNVEYIYTPSGSVLKKIAFHFRMLRAVLASDADVVMFGFQAAHLIPLVRLARPGKKTPKLVMDIRTIPVDVPPGLPGKIQEWRYKASLKIADLFCDGITVITPMLASTVKPFLRKLQNRLGVWTSGVNLQQFSRQGLDMRAALKLEGKTVLFYHGVLSPNRGLQNAIRALDLLRNKIKNLIFLKLL